MQICTAGYTASSRIIQQDSNSTVFVIGPLLNVPGTCNVPATCFPVSYIVLMFHVASSANVLGVRRGVRLAVSFPLSLHCIISLRDGDPSLPRWAFWFVVIDAFVTSLFLWVGSLALRQPLYPPGKKKATRKFAIVKKPPGTSWGTNSTILHMVHIGIIRPAKPIAWTKVRTQGCRCYLHPGKGTAHLCTLPYWKTGGEGICPWQKATAGTYLHTQWIPNCRSSPI